MCPPQIRGPKNFEFFHKRVLDMWLTHKQLFAKHGAKPKEKKLSLPFIDKPTLCNGPFKPPVTFFGEPLYVQNLIVNQNEQNYADLVMVLGIDDITQQNQILGQFLK